MVAIGLGLIWFGYTVGIWGYNLVAGNDVTFADQFKMQWPGTTPAAGAAPGPAKKKAKK